MYRTAARIAQEAALWPVRSQLASRRNALVACTALAERRREREEVEDFLEHHLASRAADPVTLEVHVRPA